MKEHKEKSKASCLSCKHFKFKVKSETKALAMCIRPNMESFIKGGAWQVACIARERVGNDSILWRNFHQIFLYGDLVDKETD